MTADLAGREADVRGLQSSLEENQNRMQELKADLDAGNARKETAEDELEACRNELRNVQEDVTAANNTINGYAMRQESRAKRAEELENQSRELVRSLLNEYESGNGSIWDTEIFGRSLYDLVKDGMGSKLTRMPDEARTKLRQSLESIINDGTGGMICILL